MQVQKMLTLASEVCALAWYWWYKYQAIHSKRLPERKKTFQEIDEMTWTLAHIYQNL